MSVSLLDVNVLVALFDAQHQNHESVHQWFARNHKRGWATCPLTMNGFVRVIANPAYPTVRTTPGEAIARLREFCSDKDHHFWEDSARLTDESLFRGGMILGHKNITDVYLLGLAVRNHGVLATLDYSISFRPVLGSRADHIVRIGGD